MEKIYLLVFWLMVSNSYAKAQTSDSLKQKGDSLSVTADSSTKQQGSIRSGTGNEEEPLTFAAYFTLIGSNTKQAFTKPFHMRGRDWKYFGTGAGTIVLLSFVDQPVQKFALDLRKNNKELRRVSRYVINFGGLYEGYALGALGLYGFVFNNPKMKTTTLLASQSYLLGTAVASVMKFLSGRNRPSFFAPNTVAKPTFKGPFAKSIDYTGANTNSAFPSGHTTVAFAAATVYALEYKNKPWVPVVSYTVASLVGLSRITENKHWTTDVLAGAALGYLSGKLVVNNYHRFAKPKANVRKKATIGFSGHYQYGRLTPTLIYTFK